MNFYAQSPSHSQGKSKFKKEKTGTDIPCRGERQVNGYEQPTFQQSYLTNRDNKMQTNLYHNI
jgi:hypothetical protein